jgi:hypothetical protein
VDGRDVGRSVVGHHALDGDRVAGVERDRASQKRDRAAGLLVGEDLDVGQAGGVIDADVHELPTGHPDAPAVAARLALAGAAAGHAMPRAADAAEFLDVDVNELARPSTLIAIRRLWRLKPRKLAQPDPRQHRRNRRGRHLEHHRDLPAGHAQATQRRDHQLALGRRAVRNLLRGRAAIQHTALSAGAVAKNPLPACSGTGLSRLRSSPDRPALLDDPQHHSTPLRQ